MLTRVVARDRLVEAHAKNALASSGAEAAGPASAGALIKLVGAPLALLVDAALRLISAVILRGILVNEQTTARPGKASTVRFWRDLRVGVRFVTGNRLLVALAFVVGGWQMFHQVAFVVQILFAARVLHLSAQAVGLNHMATGVGTVVASAYGNRISRRIDPGPCLLLGFGICGAGWLTLALAPAGPGVWRCSC